MFLFEVVACSRTLQNPFSHCAPSSVGQKVRCIQSGSQCFVSFVGSFARHHAGESLHHLWEDRVWTTCMHNLCRGVANWRPPSLFRISARSSAAATASSMSSISHEYSYSCTIMRATPLVKLSSIALLHACKLHGGLTFAAQLWRFRFEACYF